MAATTRDRSGNPPTESLRVLQWNCNGIRAHQDELRNFLSTPGINIDVACLDETFLKPGTVFNLRGYTVIRNDRTDGARGGQLIAVKDNLSYIEIDNDNINGAEIQSVQIKTIAGNITVTNGYMRPDKPAAKDQLEKLFRKESTIITGDFNAKSTLWGSPDDNEAGRTFEQLIDNHDYVVVNTGQPTRQNFNGNMSHLDITLVSRNLGAKCRWSVLNDCLGSDHLPTVTVIGEPPEIDTNWQSKFKLDTADWTEFKKQCNDLITNDLITDDVAQSATLVSEAIIKAANTCIQQTKRPRGGRRRQKRLPYWNDNIKKVIRERNTARNKANRTRDPADCSNYRRLKGRCQQVIKSTAKQHWHDYCSTLQSTTRLTTVWAAARRMNGVNSSRSVPSLVSNGVKYETNAEKAELFVDTFAQVSSDSNYTEEFRKQKDDTLREQQRPNDNGALAGGCSTEFNEPFALYELQAAISRAKKNSAPGEDRIAYEMLQQLPKRCQLVLLRLYNKIWSSGSVPADFKHSIILPLPKPNKNTHDPSSYRPISLNSTVEKIMERLVADRLTYYLEKNSLLNNVQTGFRKGRSTIDQIIRLQDEINRSINNGRATLAIFIDFERAFDMLWKDGLLIKLRRMGIEGNMYSWINSFLSDRTIQVKVGETMSGRRNLDNGTPQGSPLSPLLFLIAINDLPDCLTEVETSLFADDCALFKSVSNHQLDNATATMQKNLDAVQMWCDKWGFKMSVNKTVGVLFTRDRHLKEKMKPIVINGKPIKIEKEAKFLGLYFDERLNWQSHFDYIIKRCNARLNLMRSVTGSSWGASKASLLLIYRALVRSVLDYGAIAFDSATEAQKRRLDVIQCKALRIATGAAPATSLAALQAETGEPPLQIRRLEQQIRYAVRVNATDNHPANSVMAIDWRVYYGHYKPGTQPLIVKVEDFLAKHASMEYQTPALHNNPPWRLKQPKVDTQLASRIRKTDAEIIIKSAALEKIETYANCLHLYTDGSKTEQGVVAAAFNVPSRNVHEAARLTNNVTIYAAEMTAIILALRWLQTQVIHQPVALFSDSLSSLESLKSRRSQSRPNLLNELQETIHNARADITFVWIPGHSGLRHNDEVDALAKAATSHRSVDKDIKFELQDSNAMIEKYCTEKWQLEWTNNKKGRHLHSIQPNVTRKPPTRVYGSRRKEVSMTRLRLGKCNLNSYLHLIRRHSTGLCATCHVPETIEHHLIECVASNTRNELKTRCNTDNLPFDLPSVLTNEDLVTLICSTLDRQL